MGGLEAGETVAGYRPAQVDAELVPAARATSSAYTILPLDAEGLPQDAGAYRGILKITVDSGSISVSANNTEITNFVYQAAAISVLADGRFHEVVFSFASLSRVRSEQAALTTAMLASLNITAFWLQNGTFAVGIDEVSFHSLGVFKIWHRTSR